jgi:hypothetical protein
MRIWHTKGRFSEIRLPFVPSASRVAAPDEGKQQPGLRIFLHSPC